MKVLITGASGFIGKNLVEKLKEHNKYDIITIDREKLEEYNSNNTQLLNVEEVKEKLLTLSYIREEIEAWRNR